MLLGLTLIVLNLKMDCSKLEIWPVYMNYRGNFHLKFIYNKQSRPLIWVFSVCKVRVNWCPALQGLNRDLNCLTISISAKFRKKIACITHKLPSMQIVKKRSLNLDYTMCHGDEIVDYTVLG